MLLKPMAIGGAPSTANPAPGCEYFRSRQASAARRFPNLGKFLPVRAHRQHRLYSVLFMAEKLTTNAIGGFIVCRGRWPLTSPRCPWVLIDQRHDGLPVHINDLGVGRCRVLPAEIE
jgi:hypothetical protein